MKIRPEPLPGPLVAKQTDPNAQWSYDEPWHVEAPALKEGEEPRVVADNLTERDAKALAAGPKLISLEEQYWDDTYSPMRTDKVMEDKLKDEVRILIEAGRLSADRFQIYLQEEDKPEPGPVSPSQFRTLMNNANVTRNNADAAQKDLDAGRIRMTEGKSAIPSPTEVLVDGVRNLFGMFFPPAKAKPPDDA